MSGGFNTGECASWYARHGMPFFPLSVLAVTPIVNRPANIGISTGTVSELLVVDVAWKLKSAMEKLEPELGRWIEDPLTLWVIIMVDGNSNRDRQSDLSTSGNSRRQAVHCRHWCFRAPDCALAQHGSYSRRNHAENRPFVAGAGACSSCLLPRQPSRDRRRLRVRGAGDCRP